MSAVFLNIGQCGNQLGQCFWQEVEEWTARTFKGTQSRPSSLSSTSSAQRLKTQTGTTNQPGVSTKSRYLPYSLINGTLPCLWVDTDSKVIRAGSKSRTGSALKDRVPSDCCVVLPEGSGRGSNWAYGYHGKKGANSDGDSRHPTLQSVEDRMRKLVERCDRFGGTVLMHSLAGGTGAGLSSALLERIRDNYPLGYILSIPIAPFSLGDTPLQHYNSLLCVSWLQSYSDAVLLIQNDVVLQHAQQLLLDGKGSRGGGGASRGIGKRVSVGGGAGGGGGGGGRERELLDGPVSLDDMNKGISQVLCNSLMPIWSVKQSSPSYACQEPWELVRSLCPDPNLKFITPIHTESSHYTWEQATTNLLNPSLMRRKNTETGEYQKGSTLSLVLIARGSPNSINNSLIKGSNLTTLEDRLKEVYNTVKWNPFPVDFWFSHEVQLIDRKFATALVNGSIVCDYLETVVHQAGLMHKERAYLHWYDKYGCEEDTFREAFDVTQTIIDNYVSLR